LAYSFDIIPYSLEDNSNFIWDQDIKVYEKLNGHKVTLFNYHGEWIISSKKIVDASNPVSFKTLDGSPTQKISMSDQFWAIWKEAGYTLPRENHSNICFTFQIIITTFRRVVKYDKDDIILIAVRDMTNFRELDPYLFKDYGWNIVTLIPELKSRSDIEEEIKRINPFKLIGFIAVDRNYKRIQFNSTQYISVELSLGFLNKISTFNIAGNNFEDETLLELSRINKARRFLFYFGKWEEILNNVSQPYFQLIQDTEKLLENIPKNLKYKDYAEYIKNLKLTKIQESILFDIKKEWGFLPPRKYFSTLNKGKFKKIYDMK